MSGSKLVATMAPPRSAKIVQIATAVPELSSPDARGRYGLFTLSISTSYTWLMPTM